MSSTKGTKKSPWAVQKKPKKRRQSKQPERQLQNAILEYLNYLPDVVAIPYDNKGTYDPTRKRFRTRPKYYIKGVGDIVGWFRTGHLFWMEIKNPGRYQSSDQKTFQQMAESTGAIYVVCRSLEDAETFITETRDRLYSG